MKAGKSTLLNALVGEQVAPTDAGECTRVVTWYRDGTTPKIVLHPRTGAPRPLPVRRHDGALTIDLGADARRAVRAAGGRLAGAEPAVHHADRHPGDRLDVGGGLAAHRRLPRPRRRHAHRGRRRRLPDAARARPRRRVPRGVPRPRAWPGRRPSTPSRCSRGPTRSAGAGSTPCSRPAASPRRYRSDPTVRGLCQNVVAVAGLLAADRPDPAAGRAHRARRAGPRGARRAGDRAAVGRPVPAGGARRGRDDRGAPPAAGAVRPVRHPAVAPR